MTALALTPQPATASVLLQLTGMPADITNLLPNPGIEVDTTGWQEQGTATTIARSTAQKDTGAAALLASIGTDNGLAVRTNVIGLAADAPGKTFGARLRVRSATATTVSLGIRFIQADSATTTNTVNGPAIALAANVWTTISVTAVAAALTANARLHFNKLDGTARSIYLDSGVLRRVAVAGEVFDPAFYFAGTLPQSFTITRSDANGVAPVRLRDGQAPIAGVLNVTDYEPALIGAAVYDVVDTQQARTTATTTLAGAVTRPQIVGVQEPQLAVAPELVTGYGATRDTGSSVLRVLGRGDPVVILAPTRSREGTLDVWCRDHADALEVAQVMAAARILMLRQPTHPGMDMYFLAQSIDTTPLDHTDEGWRWQTSARYVEVRNPNLPLLGGAGWTFDDLVVLYPTFGVVRSTFATFNALAVGP